MADVVLSNSGYEEDNNEIADDERAPLIVTAKPDDTAEDNDNGADERLYSEKLAFGSISSHVYKSYIRAVGYCLAIWVLISLTLMQGNCWIMVFFSR